MPLVYDNEPHLALFSQNHGLHHYEQILKKARYNLQEKGVIIFEIAYNKKDEIIKLAKRYFDDIGEKNEINTINNIGNISCRNKSKFYESSYCWL